MKVALITNDDFSVWHFRRRLLEALIARGDEVIVIGPAGPYVQKIESTGATYAAVPIGRFVSPVSDLRAIGQCTAVLRRERVELAHLLTIKPIALGGIAARLAGTPTVAMVSGSGYAFGTRGGARQRTMRLAVRVLLRHALKRSERVWFQNPDDEQLFVTERLVDSERAVCIRGSGVDVQVFRPDALDAVELEAARVRLGLDSGRSVVGMVCAQMLAAKGVREFLTAAATLATRCPEAQFVLVGPDAPDHPDGLTEAEIHLALPQNVVWVPAFQHDVLPVLAVTDIVVLPSYYREGVPRSLLEALALGKVVVTTDHPGCRETVDDGVNGYLVSPRDSRALADAILRVLRQSPAERAAMKAAARRKACLEFDEVDVVERVLREIYEPATAAMEVAR